jgi:hypothetical protein
MSHRFDKFAPDTRIVAIGVKPLQEYQVHHEGRMVARCVVRPHEKHPCKLNLIFEVAEGSRIRARPLNSNGSATRQTRPALPIDFAPIKRPET